MTQKKNEETQDVKSKEEVKTIKQWGETLDCVASLVGACIRFELKKNDEVTEKAFKNMIAKYRGQSI